MAATRRSTLTTLIEQALRNSPDLHAAQAKLRQARAQRALAGAELFPTLRVRRRDSGRRPAVNPAAAAWRTCSMPDSTPVGNRTCSAASWRGEEAAQADLEASEANLHNVQVSLSAEVALNYVELRNYQTRLEIAKANADSQLEPKLTQWRAEAGLTTALDVEQARSNLEQTRAQIPSLDTGREAEHRLAILLGQQPGTLHSTLANSAKIPEIPERVIVTIPADTLAPTSRRARRRTHAGGGNRANRRSRGQMFRVSI